MWLNAHQEDYTKTTYISSAQVLLSIHSLMVFKESEKKE
jgi:hypothetical protein